MKTRTCKVCDKEYPETGEFFYYSKAAAKDGGKKYLRHTCKKCELKQRQEHSKKPEVAHRRRLRYQTDSTKQYQRDRYAEMTSFQRDQLKYKQLLARLERVYKLDESGLRSLMDSQKGCCAICGESLPLGGVGKTYCIDHCHETGGVRGLLCRYCNLLLGNSKDDTTILRGAINYLDNPSHNQC